MGLRFDHPIASHLSGSLKARTVHHIEVENTDGKTIDNSGHGLGWESGAGLGLELTDRLDLLPGVRYRVLWRDLTIHRPYA